CSSDLAYIEDLHVLTRGKLLCELFVGGGVRKPHFRLFLCCPSPADIVMEFPVFLLYTKVIMANPLSPSFEVGERASIGGYHLQHLAPGNFNNRLFGPNHRHRAGQSFAMDGFVYANINHSDPPFLSVSFHANMPPRLLRTETHVPPDRCTLW